MLQTNLAPWSTSRQDLLPSSCNSQNLSISSPLVGAHMYLGNFDLHEIAISCTHCPPNKLPASHVKTHLPPPITFMLLFHFVLQYGHFSSFQDHMSAKDRNYHWCFKSSPQAFVLDNITCLIGTWGTQNKGSPIKPDLKHPAPHRIQALSN